MLWFQIFQDGPEYEARIKRGTFTPPNLSLKQLHDAVPRHLHEKSTLKSVAYILRHIAFIWGFYYLATFINVFTSSPCGGDAFTITALLLKYLVRPSLWILYWGWQGIAFAGIWCLGMIPFIFLMAILLALILPTLKGHEVWLVFISKYLKMTSLPPPAIRLDTTHFHLIGQSIIVSALSSIHLSSLPTIHGGSHTVPITYVPFFFFDSQTPISWASHSMSA